MDVDFYTKIDQELIKVPYCSSKCNYFMICPVCDRSGTDLGACALRMLPEDKRRRFVNLYLRGREGMRAEATELLFNLAAKMDLHNNPAHMTQYIDTILKIDRAFKVTNAEIKRVEDIEDAELIPERVEVTINQKAKRTDPDERIVRKVLSELDDNPDSLFNSPILNKMKAKVKLGEMKMPTTQIPIEIKIDPYKSPEPDPIDFTGED